MFTQKFSSINKFISFAILLLISHTGSATTTSGDAQPSLYDRLGGLPAISMVVSDFIDALVPDPVINENPAVDAARTRVPPAYLKYHVTALVCQVTGGPCQYQGRDMKSSHSHLSINEREWDRMVEVFVGILDKYNVPEKEVNELLSIVGSTKADIVKS